MISKVYVYIDGLEDTPVICGVATLDTEKKIGEFRYGKSYLQREDCFAIDPIQLPLTQELFTTYKYKGVFGVLSDAGADSWGEKIILSIHKTKPKNRLEFLLAGAGMGVGSLVFGLSRNNCKQKHSINTLGDIPTLLKAKDVILMDKSIPAEAKKAYENGSSMGGARPKTTIVDNHTSFLAKFNRPDDLFNTVKVEHASMMMLQELNQRVAKTKTMDTVNGSVLLVERFDVKNSRPTHHFISASALINTDRITQSTWTTTLSYGFLAECIMKFGSVPEDAHELYQRMVFNVLIGNTDDHMRNHAMIYSFSDKSWRLSPAYDVLPVSSSLQQSMGLGESGRAASFENLMSQCDRFGLTNTKAKKIINQTCELVEQWPSYFIKHGVGEGDIERLKAIIPDQNDLGVSV